MESQSDYHMKTYGSLMTTTPFDNGIRYITVAPESPIYHRTTTHHHRHTTQHGTPQIDPVQVGYIFKVYLFFITVSVYMNDLDCG